MTALQKYVSKAAWWTLTLIITALVATAAYIVGKRFITNKLAGNVPVHGTPASFDSRDVVQFMPVPSKVMDTTSDMTVNAVLDGGFGPAVVMIYAEWCVHCKTMMPAYEAAAAKANIPFVRVQGQSAPVASQKHKVFGYPTVLGVNAAGNVARFSEERSETKLLDFAGLMAGLRPEAIPAVLPIADLVVPSASDHP